MAKQRLNIDIEASLWKEVGIRAIQEGINKKDLVEKLRNSRDQEKHPAG